MITDIFPDVIWQPADIERTSLSIVEEFLRPLQLPPGEKAVVGRLIHTSGDPALAGQVCFHPRAVAAGVAALQRGCHIYTDVSMLVAGINSKQLSRRGGMVHCAVHDPAVAAEAKARGITRAAVAMERFGEKLNNQIVAIGNAPTALFALLGMIRRGLRPALIIGMPVGFVGAAEAKELLMQGEVPYITVRGTRGGSPLAAAAVNALLYLDR
ncbi:precorrin-8X methylmutase [Desulforamulus hydrothermalis]|uniref:Precorrin-8X methylmutase n=1 Tax=Desulforamulus hydrothermalis Lam5 = DSM 18033 TaxID=1121428 RepID=K8DYT7_9FIRM|nr:precorrin-8X methylmutase [Desulforamulus hydrothermalis]CCO07975.1 Precorrin-8X methylmutase [Desulforamulus hydrothermalis Lam5 = DSM 18033]SHG84993.1 precorrin-8X methylmutase [Desulforamulus hydrothermalis Lam5 = DSM 18033]